MSIDYINYIKRTPVLKQILKSRGVDTEKKLAEFISQKPQTAYNPFLLADMQAGVDLLFDAIESGSKIVVYGDYDCDGVTSTALMMKILGCLTDNVSYYIPSRLEEGYGLNKDAIDKIYQNQGELIITVDCGSVSADEVLYAHELGIETIVTDHHKVREVISPGIVINPQRSDDEYPFRSLAGVGVAYKLALAMRQSFEIPHSIITEVLELVALGTIADVMPLVDENRSFVKYGLRLMRAGFRNKGLKRLAEMSGLDIEKITATNIAFTLAPRINAAGRLGDATLGVKLLLSENEDEIESLCKKLMEINQKRRELQEEAFNICQISAQKALSDGDLLMIEAKNAYEGILGIVAGKLKEEFNRPVIIVSENGGNLKGTGRSIPGIDLYLLLNKHREDFIKFGGHKAACGFTIEKSKLEGLKRKLNDDLAEMAALNDKLFENSIETDAVLKITDATIDFAKALQLFAPFGAGNPEPVFEFGNAEIVNWQFLSNEKHARFYLLNGDTAVQCILFNKAQEYYQFTKADRAVRVYGKVDINSWMDKENIQIKVIGIE